MKKILKWVTILSIPGALLAYLIYKFLAKPSAPAVAGVVGSGGGVSVPASGSGSTTLATLLHLTAGSSSPSLLGTIGQGAGALSNIFNAVKSVGGLFGGGESNPSTGGDFSYNTGGNNYDFSSVSGGMSNYDTLDAQPSTSFDSGFSQSANVFGDTQSATSNLQNSFDYTNYSPDYSYTPGNDFSGGDFTGGDGFSG